MSAMKRAVDRPVTPEEHEAQATFAAIEAAELLLSDDANYARLGQDRFERLRTSLLRWDVEQRAGLDDPEPYVGDDGNTCQDEDGRFAPLYGLDGSGPK